MKVWQYLQMEKVIHQRQIPSDLEEEPILYFSESKGDHVNILDLDLHHLLRIVRKLIDNDTQKEASVIAKIKKLIQ